MMIYLWIKYIHVITLRSDMSYVYKTIWRQMEIMLLYWSLFRYALLCVLSSFAIILARKSELVDLLKLSCLPDFL